MNDNKINKPKSLIAFLDSLEALLWSFSIITVIEFIILNSAERRPRGSLKWIAGNIPFPLRRGHHLQVRQLERFGYLVGHKPDKDTGWKQTFSITDSGKARLAQLNEEIGAGIDHYGITDAEIAAIESVTKKVRAH